ncbi:MAG: Xylulose kinase [Anaerolineales bacterium]|nr:Xylulose kinase [Anaerolineales bacterium]
MSTFLSIDLGTTGLKVALLTEAGQLVGSEYREYPIQSPQPGYAEQDPEAWWEGFITACRRLKDQHPAAFDGVAGIGICGQMHTQVYLDGNDEILRPAITWMDQRSSDIVDRINEDDEAKDLVFQETRNFATTTYTAPHMKWVKLHQPDIWRRVTRVLVAKDFIKFTLTGQMVTDYSEASGTLLFDVEKRAWSDRLFEFFGFPRSLFPEVGPSDEIVGHVTREAAELTGIRPGTPVANGSSDNSASALGAGMIHPGQVTLIIGTAGVISVCSERPLADPQNRTLCWHYCLRDKWITLGVTQSAGESLNWFKNAFDTQADVDDDDAVDIFEQYNQSVAQIPDGSDGLIFLPYLNGERTPYWDPFARGVYYGISLSTGKAHFIKSVMEGVSFALRNNIETVESLGIAVNEVRAVGGGLKSPVWLNILGKILQKPIVSVGVPDTANVGNALLCGRALGIYPSLEDAVSRMVTTDSRVAYETATETYEKQYSIFLELYAQLKGTFRRSAS